MIRAGKMDRRVTIRRAGEDVDDFNEVILSWNDLATVWGSRRNATANERLAAQEIGAEITDIFDVRYSELTATINPADRLIENGIEYNVVSVVEIGRREGFRITATARAA